MDLTNSLFRLFVCFDTMTDSCNNNSNGEVLRLMRNAKKAFSSSSLEDEYAIMWGLQSEPEL